MRPILFSQSRFLPLLLAFLFSLFLWFSLSTPTVYPKLIKGVSIKLKTKPNFYAKSYPSDVDLKIECKKGEIGQPEKEIYIAIDLSNYAEEEVIIHELKNREVIRPPGIQIIEIKPKNIIITIKKVSDKKKGR